MTPHTQKTSDSLGQTVSRIFVATLIPVFGLFILRLVLASLPMIKNAGTIGDLGLTPLVLMKASLDTVIYFLIIRLCIALNDAIRTLRPHLGEIASVILLSGCALVATLAYSGYEVLFITLAPSQSELYNWIFLAIVLAPIAMIVVIVTRRLDFFTNLMFGKLNEVATHPQSFAAAPAGYAGTPLPPAAPPPPPAAINAGREIQDRVNAVAKSVKSAQVEADRLRARNALDVLKAESAEKMHAYLDGALTAIAQSDWDGARHFADWAEYEASRLLSGVS